MTKFGLIRLVWCPRNSYTFVALKLACSEARGGRIPLAGCNRRVTKLQANFSATLWAAVFFRADFVARSLQIHKGYARRSRLVRTKNSVPRMYSYFGDTTLGMPGVFP